MGGNLESDRQAIAENLERTMHAENVGNAEFFQSACVEDVVVMPPGMPAFEGRDAAVGFMRAFLGQFDLTIDYVSEEIRVDGDLAYDRGTYSQTLVPRAGGKAMSEKGKFLWIYGRVTDGTWRMSRVIWNANEPAPE